MRLRSKAREVALCLLYQIEMIKIDFKKALDNYCANFPQKQEVISFSGLLTQGVLRNLPQIDSLIKKYAKNWEIKRMAAVDRNCLRIATFELFFVDDIPPKVSINEAIELAKRFGDVDSPRFVNGILDKIYKSERPEKDV